jgi:hypothetical protein
LEDKGSYPGYLSFGQVACHGQRALSICHVTPKGGKKIKKTQHFQLWLQRRERFENLPNKF